jgi:carboxyl-terminal processing protease
LLEATTLTGLFIDKGPVVQVRNSNGRISLEEDVEAGMAWQGPLAVLVNRYSASASEIFAAAIQDYGRGLIIGEPTFGKGTVQSLLDLDDYAPADSPKMGQLKITMAQFFRVNGGSTQNRGVEPDIRFPSAGDPAEYGERSLHHALPWTTIDPARYQPAGDMSRLAAVAENRYESRAGSNEEFNWLLADIAEYNTKFSQTRVSLLESSARAELAEEEAKREKRKAEHEGADPLVKRGDVLMAESFDEFSEAPAADDEDDAADEGPDLLLREAARIVSDVTELESDLDLLNRKFSQLNAKTPVSPQMN